MNTGIHWGDKERFKASAYRLTTSRKETIVLNKKNERELLKSIDDLLSQARIESNPSISKSKAAKVSKKLRRETK